MSPLVLSSLEQPLGHLVLLYDVHLSTPTRQGVSVDCTEECLGHRLEEVFRRLQNQLVSYLDFRK